jgi:cell division protein FtsI/penicillin-binding protein 2
MRDAVRTGTGRGADIPGLEVCGKTGTAQNPGGDDHAWFACLAPASNPQLALVVLVENAGYGSRSALPIAAAILREAQIRGHITVEAHP